MPRVRLGIRTDGPPLEPQGPPTYGEVVAANTALRVQLDALATRLAALESANLALSADNLALRARLGMNSRNSSKPPSSDGYAKPAPKSRRVRSGKKPGKQPGAPGRFLPQVEDPDAVIEHKPDQCADCGETLVGAPVTKVIRRQVYDLPAIEAFITEHRAQRRRCQCGCETTALFPSEASGPACYGPNLRAAVQGAYATIIAAGHLANPPEPPNGRQGPPRRSPAANLLARLDDHADEALRFATDFRVSFDNNEAERQVRMLKVQQKISGGFRTTAGAHTWLGVRSYVATTMKNGINPLNALQLLMAGDPWMPIAPDSG
jgi:hypothetical protein